MPPLTGSFNANQFEPNQGFGVHPPAQKVQFQITGTEIKETAAKDGGYFRVEFTSPLGVINQNYNIWNKTPKAVEIAHGQLSALCRAVQVYNIDWGNEGAALRGARGLMDVGYQKGEEPSADNPDAKGYTELKRVYDLAGNDPSRPASAQAAQPQVQPASAPMVAQPGGGWGSGIQGQPANQQQSNPSWGTTQQPSQPAQNTGQAWQPGGQQAGANPPWGSRA
jgi:hypothetical protein